VDGIRWADLPLHYFDERHPEPVDPDEYWERLGYNVEGERARDERRR
jgi:hypothetical protein